MILTIFIILVNDFNDFDYFKIPQPFQLTCIHCLITFVVATVVK